MKKTYLAVAMLGAFSSAALAQSNVEIFGIIDTGIRYTDNNPVAGGVANQTALMAGGLWGSRFGLKGEEDLGGGTAAVFKLENGFDPTKGTLGQQGQLFGRQAFVGLKDSSWGEIDAGRQYGVAAIWDFTYDPIGVGNYNESSWEYYLFGYRFDNTLKYKKAWGPLTASVQYSFGGQAASTGIGASEGFSLDYVDGPLRVGGFYQQSEDANSKQQKVAGLGSTYLVGPATLYLQYFSTTRDPGFVKAGSLSGGALANTSLLSNAGNPLQRKDGLLTAGVSFNRAHDKGWTYTLVYMHDAVSDELSANGLSDGSGAVTTVYGIAEYNFSKRTEVYFDIDHTNLSGNEINGKTTVMAAAGSSFGGNTGRTGLGLGVIVKF